MEKGDAEQKMDFEKIWKDEILLLVGPFIKDESCDLFKLINELIQLERTIIDKRGNFKNYLEKDVLDYICSVYVAIIDEYEFDFELLDKSLIRKTKEKDLKRAHEVSLMVLDLVKFIFDFKMPRDNFSNLRKGLAISLLTQLLFEYEIEGDLIFIK